MGATPMSDGHNARRSPEANGYSLWQLVVYALKLGTIGFGGPVALIGYMYRDLVETRRWISEADYKEGLTLAQLMPGPLAAQLAIYLGYVHYRVRGATLVGIAFVAPSFLMVVALGWLYQRFGGLSWMQAVFYGVGAAVIGIIAISAYRLTTKNIGRDRLLWAIYLVSAALTAITAREVVWIYLGAGILVWLLRAPPATPLAPGSVNALTLAAPMAGSVDWPLLAQLGAFFAKAGALVFGSGLAIVPFLYGGVVAEHHWLNEQQFIDAVAVAMITPGPVVITVAFIGFLVAGLLGALVAATGVFLPPYVVVIAFAPSVRRWSKNERVKAFVAGVTAAAAGAIAGASIVLGRRAIIDVPTAAICGAVLLVLWKAKKCPEPLVIVAAGVVGFFAHSLKATAY